VVSVDGASQGIHRAPDSFEADSLENTSDPPLSNTELLSVFRIIRAQAARHTSGERF
jgi:hypothetical protein